MILFLIFIGFKTYLFQKYIENIINTENLYFELIQTGWVNSNDYVHYRDIQICDQIKEIIKWEKSEESFWRGGEYPYFVFNIRPLNGKPIVLSLTIHHSQEAVQMIFSNDSNMIAYVKKVESYSVLEELISKIKK
jgi:hypothetical protein